MLVAVSQSTSSDPNPARVMKLSNQERARLREASGIGDPIGAMMYMMWTEIACKNGEWALMTDDEKDLFVQGELHSNIDAQVGKLKASWHSYSPGQRKLEMALLHEQLDRLAETIRSGMAAETLLEPAIDFLPVDFAPSPALFCQHPSTSRTEGSQGNKCGDCGAECGRTLVDYDGECYDLGCPLHAMVGSFEPPAGERGEGGAGKA